VNGQNVDNGAEVFTWPDGGMTPFKATKGTAFEGGFLVPAIIRWPGQVKPGSVENGIFSGLDWLPTLTAAAGNPNVTDQLLKGVKDRGLDRLRVRSADRHDNWPAGALAHSENWGLAYRAASRLEFLAFVFVGFLAADERFINFDDASQLARHRQADKPGLRAGRKPRARADRQASAADGPPEPRPG